jgi:hypothetical protein
MIDEPPRPLTDIEIALNLNRMYRAVKAYPQISGVPCTESASRAEVVVGYERVKENRHLRQMCLDGEAELRREQARTIEMLYELTR